jgi:hypothetical protein
MLSSAGLQACSQPPTNKCAPQAVRLCYRASGPPRPRLSTAPKAKRAAKAFPIWHRSMAAAAICINSDRTEPLMHPVWQRVETS